MYLLMCCARSEMVQCLQIRPVSLKHTSTQQLLINVFVLHSFPMKKFLKLSPSIVPNNAKMLSNKNVKFIFFGGSVFDFSVTTFLKFVWRTLYSILTFQFSFFDNQLKFLVFIILKHYPKGWRRLIDFLIPDSDGGGVYVTTLRCRNRIFEFFDSKSRSSAGFQNIPF